MSAKQIHRTGWSLVLLVLLAAPAIAGSGIIHNGIDIWKTPGDGTSWVSFAEDPIPADFFCFGSAPFMGAIIWQGKPLVTSPPDALGDADTIIARLDDAIFDDKGIAVTRVRVDALSLVSTVPIQTRCGAFNAQAVLSGKQPTTEMVIQREGKAGGRFEAPLDLIVKLSFIPVDGLGQPLELERKVSFLPGSGFFWSSKPQDLSKPKHVPLLDIGGFVLVDTDGNDKADTFLPGTSNFFPYGRTEGADKQLQEVTVPVPCSPGCHTAGGSSCHCPIPVEQH